MANTLPDVQLPAGSWIELYSTTGIAVNTPLVIQNKITAALLIQIRSTTPITTLDGYSLGAGATVYLDGMLSGVWVRCSSAGRVVVMDNSVGDA